jgi:hypothetical protein
VRLSTWPAMAPAITAQGMCCSAVLLETAQLGLLDLIVGNVHREAPRMFVFCGISQQHSATRMPSPVCGSGIRRPLCPNSGSAFEKIEPCFI